MMDREWVLKSGMLVAMSVYTYLRLIVDHGTPNLLSLRQREVDFCIGLLRERVSTGKTSNLDVRFFSKSYTTGQVWNNYVFERRFMSYAHQGIIHLIKNTVKTVVL